MAHGHGLWFIVKTGGEYYLLCTGPCGKVYWYTTHMRIWGMVVFSGELAAMVGCGVGPLGHENSCFQVG